MYLVSTPWWLRRLYPTLCWQMGTSEKHIYLTFDDGPHETATPFVLETLKQYYKNDPKIAEELTSHIMNNREEKMNETIQRKINKII